MHICFQRGKRLAFRGQITRILHRSECFASGRAPGRWVRFADDLWGELPSWHLSCSRFRSIFFYPFGFLLRLRSANHATEKHPARLLFCCTRQFGTLDLHGLQHIGRWSREESPSSKAVSQVQKKSYVLRARVAPIVVEPTSHCAPYRASWVIARIFSALTTAPTALWKIHHNAQRRSVDLLQTVLPCPSLSFHRVVLPSR